MRGGVGGEELRDSPLSRLKKMYKKGKIGCFFRRGKAMKMLTLIEFLDLLSENGIYAFTNGMIRNFSRANGKRI